MISYRPSHQAGELGDLQLGCATACGRRLFDSRGREAPWPCRRRDA